MFIIINIHSAPTQMNQTELDRIWVWTPLNSVWLLLWRELCLTYQTVTEVLINTESYRKLPQSAEMGASQLVTRSSRHSL